MKGAETEILAARPATILETLQGPVRGATGAAVTLLLPTRYPLPHGMQAFSKQARRPTVCFAEGSPTKRQSDGIQNGRNSGLSPYTAPPGENRWRGAPFEPSRCLMDWFEKSLIPFRFPNFPRWTNPGRPTGRQWGPCAARIGRRPLAGGATPTGASSSCRDPRGTPCALKNESEGTQTMIAREPGTTK